jgi:precorrin-6x reductase
MMTITIQVQLVNVTESQKHEILLTTEQIHFDKAASDLQWSCTVRVITRTERLTMVFELVELSSHEKWIVASVGLISSKAKKDLMRYNEASSQKCPSLLFFI